MAMIGDVNAFVQEIVVTSALRHLRCVRHCSALLCSVHHANVTLVLNVCYSLFHQHGAFIWI